MADACWRALVTLYEMLDARGYRVDCANDVPSVHSVRACFVGLDVADEARAQPVYNQFRITSVHRVTGARILVYWLCGKIGVNSVSLQQLREFCPDEGEGAPDVLVLVLATGCKISSARAKQALAELPVAHLETFEQRELLFNPLKHVLQSKYTVLSDAEKNDLLLRYCCAEDQLNALTFDSPVRRFLGLEPGQVVRCERRDDMCVDVVYRRVLPPKASKKRR